MCSEKGRMRAALASILAAWRREPDPSAAAYRPLVTIAELECAAIIDRATAARLSHLLDQHQGARPAPPDADNK